MFDLNGQTASTGGGEYSSPIAAREAIISEFQEGIAAGLTPIRGVILEKRGGEDFCSHILTIAK